MFRVEAVLKYELLWYYILKCINVKCLVNNYTTHNHPIIEKSMTC